VKQAFPIATATGQPVWYDDPSKTEILADDLRIQLARIRRYGGAIDVTVLQHTALCVELARAAGVDANILCFVAAHDLHEAYILDLPTPMKAFLVGYAEMEEAWAQRVHEALGLGWPLHPKIAEVVKMVDRWSLSVEMAWCEHPNRHLVDVVTEDDLKIAARFLRPVASPGGMWKIVEAAVRGGGGTL